MLKNARLWLFLIVMLVAVAGAGFVGFLGYIDTTRIIERLDDKPEWRTRVVLDATNEKQPLLVRLYGALELDTLDARNGRAAAQLATRTWLRFLTSIFGGILIVFGAAFVLGRITAGNITAGVGNGSLTANLQTTSPGLLMAAMGVFLVSSPLWSTQEITTQDGASYGTLILTEGREGPIASLGPRMGMAVPVPTDEEATNALVKAEEE